MVRFAVLGVGRIGRMHAGNVVANPRARLECVYDTHQGTAREVAGAYGVAAAESISSVLENRDVDAVLIASPTDTHVDLLTAAATAGKAVLCEKPIDLDIDRVNRSREALSGCDVPIQIGFNRRFDPTHRAVHEAVRSGDVGVVEQILITSRDPSPLPMEYLKVSGGLYRDMMIHDFDLARFLMGREFVKLAAFGSVLVDPEIGAAGDVDTAMVVMSCASGAQCLINCSRRAVYGYDQRVEVFGSRGMVQSDNPPRNHLVRSSAQATGVREPLKDFFLDRYPEAYVLELDEFITAVVEGTDPPVTFEDGRRALMMADAANQSLERGCSVPLDFD